MWSCFEIAQLKISEPEQDEGLQLLQSTKSVVEYPNWDVFF